MNNVHIPENLLKLNLFTKFTDTLSGDAVHFNSLHCLHELIIQLKKVKK